MDRRTLLRLAVASALACGGTPSLVDVPRDDASRFRRVYGDPALRGRFRDFLVHVFHLFPQDAFHALIAQSAAAHPQDQAIYEAVGVGLPSIQPPGALLTHALPTLRTQKREMARQVADAVGRPAVDGYLEMGTTGRYLGALREHVAVNGPRFVLNDVAPSRDPADIVDRGAIGDVGHFVPLGVYDPVDAQIPDASLDLFSDLIGLHHCPDGPLEPFVASIRRVLRPGGLLVLREHDVDDEPSHALVALAHDVFNVGVALSWSENAAQIRRFRSLEGWTALLAAHGFRRKEGAGTQPGDPTDNTVLAFVKV